MSMRLTTKLLRIFTWNAKSPDFAPKSRDFRLRQAKSISLTLILSLILIACSQEITASPVVKSTQTPEDMPVPLPAGEMENVIILSMEENGYAHLFAYSPAKLPLTRLTTGDWNDIILVKNSVTGEASVSINGHVYTWTSIAPIKGFQLTFGETLPNSQTSMYIDNLVTHAEIV